jgi:hypothetical protein
MIDDPQIRSLLRKQLDSRHLGDSETVIAEELGILHGSSRIDLAVVNGELHGYELKSDRDTLRLFPEQVDAYCAVFDLVTLVVGERHLLHAIDLIPQWWGVKVARVACGDLVFRDLKLPIMNPSPDALSIARLLWRDDALRLLRGVGKTECSESRSRDWIYAQLVSLLNLDVLRHAVRQSLKDRLARQSGGPPRSCGD